jgi:phage-related protein
MSFVAQITADISNFDKNIKKAVDIADSSTKKMQAQFDRLGDSFVKIGAKASILSTAIVGATVGLVKMGISAGDASAEINNLSTATSLSTDVIQELAYVATASNSSFEGLQRSMDSFQRRLKTVGEEGSRVNEMLGKLGVSTTDASGNVRSMDDVLLDTFNKLGDMEEGLAKNAIGTELFGRSWNEVALIVSSGSKGIAELREEAHKLGLVLDENTLQSSDDFSTAMELVRFQIDKLKTKIGASFVPILQESVLPLLQEKIIPAVSRFADFIAQLSEKFNALSPSTKNAIFAITGIAAAAGPLLLSLGGIIKILPLVRAGFTAVTGPIGIAIAAIAGAAILVVKNWDSIKEYFTSGGGAELFESIKKLFITVKDVVSDVFSEIKRTITTIWNAIGDTVTKVWGNTFDTIVTTITVAVDIVRGVLNTLISLLKGDFSGALESIKTLAKDVFDGFKRIVFNSLSSMTSALSEFFSFLGLNSLADTFADWSEKIKPSTEKIVEDIQTVDNTMKKFIQWLAKIFKAEITVEKEEITEALDIFQSGTIAEAIRATSNEIKVLGQYLTDLQTGKIVVANVHDEIVRVEERLSTLNTALNTLTGDRELNIKVKTDSALDIFKDTDFGSEAGLIVPIIPTIDTSLVKDAMGDLSEGMQTITIDLASMLSSTLTDMFGAVSDAIMNGDSVIEALGASLLGTLGGIMVQLGKMVITTGEAIEAVKAALTGGGGIGAIAAGVALIAIGSAFSAGARKLSSSIGGGGGYSSAPSMQNSQPTLGHSDYRGAYRDDFKVEFKIGSNELVGVLDTANQRRNRLG